MLLLPGLRIKDLKPCKDSQQTCYQCNKREWPNIKTGWLLDYENQAVFCSPDCHFSYLEETNQLENENLNAELIHDELELPNDSNQQNFDWEKEILKKEVLTLREHTKELEKKLAESKKDKSPKSEKQLKQESYLLKLHQNTQKNAEQSFESKYGKTELDALLGSSQQSKKNYWPWIIGGGLIGGGLIIGIVVYFLTKNKKTSY